jgi:micrococcal nuclease
LRSKLEVEGVVAGRVAGGPSALRTVALLVTALFLIISGQFVQAQPAGTPVTVTEVVDGDTIGVHFVDGAQATVRIIGIDAPEAQHPDESVGCYGPEASARTTELALGKPAVLEQEVQQRDRDGRLLGNLWIDGQNLGVLLAADGYAQQFTFPPNVKYAEQIRAAAASAHARSLGLWGQCSPSDDVQRGHAVAPGPVSARPN